MKYVIYRKPDGSMDCVPETSSMIREAMANMVRIIDGTAFEAWSKLEYLERLEKQKDEPKKRRRK